MHAEAKSLHFNVAPRQKSFCRSMAVAATLLIAALAGKVFADEGMWLFNNLPSKTLKQRYGFEVTPQWTDHLMRSSVRISYGGSGSFVSADGFVLTNHHVASRAIDSIGKKTGKNLMTTGFLARNLQEEVSPNDGLEIEALVNIIDVTKDVQANLAKLNPSERNAVRKQNIARITAEAEKKTGFKCEVVTLYQGGQYHLYQYKIYRDVRLVFAPEKDIAFFGGDADNFEFPRYNLDMAIFRVYENGKPAQIRHYLTLPTTPLKENDLIFVSGNPGSTQRLLTKAAMEYVRDYQLPFSMANLWRLESLYGNFMGRGPSEKQKLENEFFSIANSRKARLGQLWGLQDPQIMDQIARSEESLVSEMKKRQLQPALQSYKKIEQARTRLKEIQYMYSLVEGGLAFNSNLFQYARTLVRASTELQKKDGDRLEEFNQAKMKTLEHKLFAELPIYNDAETLKLGDSLSQFLALAARDEFLKKNKAWFIGVLKGQSPNAFANQLIAGTQLAQLPIRKKYFAMTPDDLKKVADPMIQFAWAVDQKARAVRKIFEDEVREVERQAYDEIAKARFQILGDSVYPDATFSPRVAFGKVLGVNSGKKVAPAFTTFAGLYEREEAQKAMVPFKLPELWKTSQKKIDQTVPFNFIATADIIGGNSGSPTVNEKGELVGLIFDGNIDSLVGDFVYDEKLNRSVSVDVRAMLHSLDKVYQANHVLKSFGVPTGRLIEPMSQQ